MPAKPTGVRARAAELERALARTSGDEADRIAHAMLDLAESLRTDTGTGRGTDLMTHMDRVMRRPRQRCAERLRRAAARAAPRLGHGARQRVADAFGRDLLAVVRGMLTEDDEGSRLAGLALTTTRSLLGAVPAAAGLVESTPERVADLAARCLAELASDDAAWHAAGRDERERAASAICEAADAYPSHRRIDAVRAALYVQTPEVRAGAAGERAAQWLTETDEAVRLAARTALRSLDGPAGARRAFQLLTEPAFARAAGDRLGSVADRSEVEALLADAHLLTRPARRAAVRARIPAERAGALLPGRAEPDGRSINARRGMPRWIHTLPAPADARSDTIEPLLADPDDAARLGGATASHGSVLADFVLDRHASVSQAALTRLRFDPGAQGPDADDKRLAAITARSPHASVRRFGPRWLDRSSASSIEIARRLQRRPAETVGKLAASIEAGDAVSAHIAARLGLADHVLPALAAALRSDDPKLAATACRTLGAAASADARPLLLHALNAGDARIRSNAIEALARFDTRLGARFDPRPHADDPHHRVRATALREAFRAMAAPSGAADRVHTMLASDAANERLAGLWLTERASAELKPIAGRSWADLAARVAGMARASDERERRRATRAARRMLAVSVGNAG